MGGKLLRLTDPTGFPEKQQLFQIPNCNQLGKWKVQHHSWSSAHLTLIQSINKCHNKLLFCKILSLFIILKQVKWYFFWGVCLGLTFNHRIYYLCGSSGSLSFSYSWGIQLKNVSWLNNMAVEKKEIAQQIIQVCLWQGNSWSWYKLEKSVIWKYQEAAALSLSVLPRITSTTTDFNLYWGCFATCKMRSLN